MCVYIYTHLNMQNTNKIWVFLSQAEAIGVPGAYTVYAVEKALSGHASNQMVLPPPPPVVVGVSITSSVNTTSPTIWY